MVPSVLTALCAQTKNTKGGAKRRLLYIAVAKCTKPKNELRRKAQQLVFWFCDLTRMTTAIDMTKYVVKDGIL